MSQQVDALSKQYNAELERAAKIQNEIDNLTQQYNELNEKYTAYNNRYQEIYSAAYEFNGHYNQFVEKADSAGIGNFCDNRASQLSQISYKMQQLAQEVETLSGGQL